MKFKMTEVDWKKPTPAKMRRLGETLLVLCSIVAGSTYAAIPWVAVTAFVVGLVARGLVEFFVDTPETE